jgi:phage tail sheath protein FI
MGFQLSPGVNVSEIDLTTIVPAVATSIGAIAGKFAWGPVNEIVTISDETRLVDRFGKPDDSNYEYWFTAANFLAYSNNLKVVRAANTDTTSATATYFDAKYPGALGNSIRVEVADSNTYSDWAFANQFTDEPASNELHIIVFDEDGEFTGVANTVLEKYAFVSTDPSNKTFDGTTNYYVNVLENRSKYIVANTNSLVVPEVSGSISGTASGPLNAGVISGNTTYSDGSTGTITGTSVITTPSYEGTITGTVTYKGTAYDFSGTIEQTFGETGNVLSWTGGTFEATTEEIPGVGVLSVTGTQVAVDLNTGSSTFTGVIVDENFASPIVEKLANGADGTVGTDDIVNAYDYFKNGDVVDVSLIMTGPGNQTIVTHVIDNIAEYRKDCVVFVSPEKADVVDNYGDEVNDTLAYRNSLTSSSYAVMDCNWKYQFDKYNDGYRWVPLNGDIAGLCARTDRDRDPWYSPGGLNRGIIKNVIKLAWNPNKTDRDELYVKGVNPVVTFAGEGTILYGDKTLLSRPSAFDRINVRRLFIVLEKAIARAARSSLFEFNDSFTRAQFVNLVEPFLRDVQGRRGITDFRVVCDETNNTGEIIDRNEFIGDIYIKPARSINFIQLNFVAVRTGVSFDEIVGQFG